MTEDQIIKLERLRREGKELDSFICSNGSTNVVRARFRILKLFKNCGWNNFELLINPEVGKKIQDILIERLDEIRKEIESM